MKISAKLAQDIKALYRKNKKVELQIEKELESSIEDYREWFKKRQRKGKTTKAILAEGDSWFDYSIMGCDVIDNLQRQLGTRILNLAAHGDESREMLGRKQKDKLIRELKRGPTKNKKFDLLLFSAGGNDLVGRDRFYLWFNEYESGMSPEDVLNMSSIQAAFEILAVSYNELLKVRNKHSPSTHILFNSYDFPYPNGDGVCGKGPWLKPGMKHRKVPKEMRREVVKIFLENLDTFLEGIALDTDRVTVVKTQGTLTSESEWANELHPKNHGFEKIALVFKEAIDRII